MEGFWRHVKLKLPEIHDKKPDVPIPIREVGVVGIKMPVGFAFFENKPVMVIPVFDVFIDLPATRKGIHASRNYEIISEVLGKYAGKTYKLENVCSAIATELLHRHKYASRSEVKASGEAVVEKPTPKTGMISYEPCKMMAVAVSRKDPGGSIKVRRMVGVGVEGVTACPCAQESLRAVFSQEASKSYNIPEQALRGILRGVPLATHMQRSYGSVLTEVPEGFEVDASRLVSIVEESMSASSYGLLKRPDEVELVKQAARNPRFVEDCVRLMVKNFAKSFPELPDSILVTFKQRSRESIHKHDLVAKRTATLGEIRSELMEKGSL